MSNIEIGKAYIGAVQSGDQATLGSLLSPEVVWHQPGNNQFSGTHRGLPAVGGLLGKMMEASGGTFTITRAIRFMGNGDYVAVEIEFAGEREEAKLSQPGIDVLRIEGGTIVEVWLFSSDQEQEDAFWGR